MNRLPAASGLKWIRDSFRLVRRQPNQLTLLFLLYTTINLLMAVVIPPVGQIILVLVNQAFISAFMLGCAYADAGRQARPGLLFAYLKGPVLLRLACLGACYLLAQGIAVGGMYLFFGDILREAIAKAQTGTPGAIDPVASELVVRPLMCGMAAYAILILPLWFAAPLIAWQDMSVPKAIFFSFFSVLRAVKAFVVYILAWSAIVLFVVINMSALASVLPQGVNALPLLLLIPCMLFIVLLYFVSFYTSYVELFGKPVLPPED